MKFDSFREVDLRPRKQKIANAMHFIAPETAEDIPVIAHVPCYFGFGNAPRPVEYWSDPARMLAFQQDGYEEHLKRVHDDTVPYFMPWFGTGVLASAFGCPMRNATGQSDDPAVIGPAITDVSQIAHLRMPNPETDGWMPRVLRFMEYGVQHGEMPVGMTDLNSLLCTAAQICGYDQLFCWMYDEPQAVHDLLDMLCETFIGWVRLQREICGEQPGQAHGLQGVYTPKGGVWMSDDDLVSVGAALYEEFMVPRYSRVFTAFGGGHLHWCGVGSHQLHNITAIEHVTAVNNSPMGNQPEFMKLYRALHGKLFIEIQDAAPIDPETYYQTLFSELSDMRGMMVATFVEDLLGMDQAGATHYITHDPYDKANSIVRWVRKWAQEAINRGKQAK